MVWSNNNLVTIVWNIHESRISAREGKCRRMKGNTAPLQSWRGFLKRMSNGKRAAMRTRGPSSWPLQTSISPSRWAITMSPANPKFCVSWSKQKDLLYVAHAPNSTAISYGTIVRVFASSCKEKDFDEGEPEITRRCFVNKIDRNGEWKSREI